MNRFYPIILIAFVLLFAVPTYAQIHFTLDTVYAQPNQTACVPIRIQDTLLLNTMELSMSWNKQQLLFTGVNQSNLPGLSNIDFNPSIPGRLLMTWTDPSGSCIITNKDAVLFGLCLKTIAPPGTEALVKIDSGLVGICLEGELSVGPDTGRVIDPVPTGFFEAGYPADEYLSISPNPTTASALLKFNALKAGRHSIQVMDALGKMVLEHSRYFESGENTFEIPANALRIKGLYQVVVCTDQHSFTKILVVQ